jgi:chemotaxis signal transduction protein
MNSYCVFNVGDQRIGIPMTNVREILAPDFIVPTPVPLAPGFVHGLFNLRGQVLPCLDLSSFVGATASAPATASQRAVIVERGEFRFATLGQRIDTLEAAAEAMQPVTGAALYPALDAEAQTERGNFQVIHLDRLEACLKQAMKFTEGAESSRATATTDNTTTQS